MKKILLSAVLAASSWALFAQDTTNRTNGTMNGTMNSNTTTNQQMSTNSNQNTNVNNNSTSNQMYNSATTTSNYSAYGIPTYVQTNFQAQHPNVSNLTWTASTADFYHGYYTDPTSGRYTHVYYSTDPYYNVQYYPERVTGYTVSLPVLETWVPDAVVTTALNQYKQNLYDIAAMKGNNQTNMYVVRVLDNGELKSMYMDSTGGSVTDYLRTVDQTNMNNSVNGNTMNSNSTLSNDTNGTMNNSSNNANSSNTDMSNMNSTDKNTKMKTKTTMSDGSQLKTKTKNGKTTTKKVGSTANDNNQF
ncbi:MAG: hypothetical protein ACXVLT_04905 [Flavisolibacter sp.]